MDTTDRIRELCKQRGISMRALERELEFSNGSIAKSKQINGERLFKIAQYFGVSPEYIMGVEPQESIIQHAFDDRPEMRMLFSLAKDAPVEDIEYVIKKLEALKDKK